MTDAVWRFALYADGEPVRGDVSLAMPATFPGDDQSWRVNLPAAGDYNNAADCWQLGIIGGYVDPLSALVQERRFGGLWRPFRVCLDVNGQNLAPWTPGMVFTRRHDVPSITLMRAHAGNPWRHVLYEVWIQRTT